MNKKLAFLILVIILLPVIFFTGCNIFGQSDNEILISPTNTDSSANLKFKIVLPESTDQLPGYAAIRGAGTSQLRVVLTLRQPGVAGGKAHTLVKIFPVTSSEATITIPALPTGVVVAKIQIENGHIQGWTSLHGASDLQSGANEIEISPAGSKLPADLLASALQSAINNDDIMNGAAEGMVKNLRNAIISIDVKQDNSYDKVLETLISQVNPANMVKISYDNSGRTLTATNGSSQLWQKNFTDADILGTEPVAGVQTSAFVLIRIVKQGFGSYFVAEWRDPSSLLSLITTHNVTDGKGQQFFINQGILDQVVPVSENEYVIGGYNVSKSSPAVWKWNINKTAFSQGLAATETNMEWEHYFTDLAYSATPASGGVLANLMFDSQSRITAIVKTQAGLSRSYAIAADAGTVNSLTTVTAPNQLPIATITSPANKSSFTDQQTVTIVVDASDPDGSVAKVDFFAGSSLLGSDDSSPFTYDWSGMQAETYVLLARVTDNNGFSSLSSPVEITVTESGTPVNKAPTVTLSAPVTGSTYTLGQTVTLSANASDEDGTITKVEFYHDSTLLGSDDSAPYSYSWSPSPAGSYNIFARAYDNQAKTSDSVSITINIANPTSGNGPALMISEVSSSKYTNTPRWFELVNKTSQDIDLANYSLRAPGYNGSDISPSVTFALPNKIIKPGEFLVVRYKASTKLFDGPNLVHFADSASPYPYWAEWGFLDLIEKSSGNTIDYVKFGRINDYYPNENPTTAAEWSGDSATALPDQEGYVITRNLSADDTNAASDWTVRAFSTPGAINDVLSDIDNDGDGIPDENEAPGKTYCGISYYDYGARAGVADIFVHIDYMDPAQAPKPLAVTPRENALDRIVAAFQTRNIKIHFDVGDLFGSAGAKYNLDGRSHKVTYSETLDLSPSSGTGSAYSYKAESMPLAKLPVFHYCLIGYMPNGSFSGLGEINGNDFIVTLGNSNFKDDADDEINFMNYIHAATLMHELGHNLGLEHGGDVTTNYKPNYVSIMNYMYSNYGLPAKGNVKEGDRYYYYRYSNIDGRSSASAFKQYFTSSWWIDLHNNPYSTSVTLDYSDGTGGALNEANLNESTGLMRSGSAAVDFNGNGGTGDTGLTMDLNNDGKSEELKDYNDWAAINLNFSRSISGVASIRASFSGSLPPRKDWLVDDFQRVVPCSPCDSINQCPCANH